MQDVMNIIKNVESIYDSNTAFNVLKDFEKVLDELDLYVYKNWKTANLQWVLKLKDIGLLVLSSGNEIICQIQWVGNVC